MWVAAAAFACVARPAAAQASIQATADVQPAVTVAPLSDLQFRTVLAGTTKTVDPTSADAGAFAAISKPNANLMIRFTLPTVLTGPGGATLPIGSWTGLYNATPLTAGATAFTPSSRQQKVPLSATGNAYFWVGGTVTVGAAQARGLYSATIVLDGQFAGF